ncbi:type I glutamate--ammonia ligase [Candidatus Micrarchaeota archaeon CG1_02_55_22]|nr:MAG: type I glutamate--ammonia ligase [Candidatus Micrarchaeota archaeon CG1_02_55_22]
MDNSSDDAKREVLRLAEEKGVKFVLLRFTDVLGTPKNTEITVSKLADALADGIWFDGSSIEGFTRIHESDMLLVPDASTFAILPWTDGKVAQIVCDINTDEKKPFEGDPRYLLKKALERTRSQGFEYNVGPELEFFLFTDKNGGGTVPTPSPHDAAGYFDLSPMDLAAEVRREVVPALEAMGLEIEMLHHEVAPGQHEIDFKYGNALAIADSVMTYKMAVKTIAARHGLYASFMPKPIYGINGSGMHVHQSLWRGGENAFYDDGDEHNLSPVAKHYIAGQLSHARGLAGVVAPTVNSYKRLVPGYEAPVYVCWGQTNRSALIRVPKLMRGKTASLRCELRCPDPSSNPYLAFAAMLECGMDGITKKIAAPKPVEEDVYDFDDAKLASFYIKTLPASLDEAMAEASADEVVKGALGKHAFKTLQESQRAEWDAYRLQVTPWELSEYLPRL